MVSPRQDLWVVSADKPADRMGFDRAVKLPLEQSVRFLSYKAVSSRVYELFDSVEQANEFAAEIRSHGATNIKVSEPRRPPKGHSGSSEPVARGQAKYKLRDLLKRPAEEEGGK